MILLLVPNLDYILF